MREHGDAYRHFIGLKIAVNYLLIFLNLFLSDSLRLDLGSGQFGVDCFVTSC